MILKVIYSGFKSFADKIEVDFSKGLTTIIGPNGCGKSNIVDGIRWVLGEQSAKTLRGGKMEDIIFFGTVKRKPSDAAEVTLILDNSKSIFKNVNTQQVAVTRRTFRKGGSEYLINGEISRLKDVQNLFLDSGIGSRSYSLIGQEQAKKILSTKIEERRAIFEEAAGIVKFKQQKEQTEKSLQEVESNLTRMEDILHELKGQLDPLEKQSKKAQSYKNLSEELKTFEIQYLLHQFDEINLILKDLDASIEGQTNEVEQMDEKLSNDERYLEESKVKYQEDNEEVFSLQTVVSEKKEEIDKKINEINLLLERNKNSESKFNDAVLELKEIEKKHSLSMDEYQQKLKRLTFVESTLDSKQNEFELLTEKVNSVENDKLHIVSDYEHFRNKTVDLYNQITQKEYERNQSKERETEYKDKLKITEENLTTIQKDFEEAKNLYQSLKQDYDELSSKKEKITNQLDHLNEILDTSNKELEIKSQERQEFERSQFELKTKIDNIESFMENNEGFFDGAKAILNEKKKGSFPNVLGAFAELINVNEKFEVAIDTLLQSTMQSIITIDDSVAKECIKFLNKDKLGRATFLPLNLAQPVLFNKNELSSIHSFNGIHLATEGLTYDSQISPVVESKLGRSLIADSLDIALEFTKQTNIKTRISTLDGEIIQTGSITGGTSSRKKSNFFTKKRELEHAKEELELIQTKIIQYGAEITKTKELVDDTKQNIKKLSEELKDVDNLMSNQYDSMKDSENNFLRFNEKHQDLLTENEELKIFLKETSNKIMTLKLEVESLEKQHEDANKQLQNLHTKKENQDGNLTDMLKEITDIQTLLARLDEEQKQLQEYMSNFGENAESINDKVNYLNNRINEEELSVKQNLETIEKLNEELTLNQSEYDVIKSQLEQARKLNQSSVEEINQLEKDLKQLRIQKENLEKELNKQKIKYSKKETEIQTILQRLNEDYEITDENINDFSRQEIDMKNSEKVVKSLRKEISALGNVNHNAIDEYEELLTRYQSEKKQCDDAKLAKQDLLSLIADIEVEMTARFTETFSEIAKHFKNTFVNLFEGGKAELKLIDDKNPLTSEIEIMAQPPGKSFQSISLLSGGEQSLTAVALIFAIILAKPSPFVILDEVDAPLDDANVKRFATYLKELSKTNQFIVITHRKGTKMASDYMYGVTHEELGVSVVAQVKLDFNEKLG